MNIIFYGGTGQCKVMRPIADRIGRLIAVLDDTTDLTPPFSDVPLYSGKNCLSDFSKNILKNDPIYFAVTIGNPNGQARRDISQKLIEKGLWPLSLIHESAIIDSNVKMGTGVQVHAGVIINTNVNIGDYSILNTKCSVDHDCILGEGAEIAPGATLCGEIVVGANSWVGAGATILPRIKIGKNAIVGAGAVVTKTVYDYETVVGIPASPIKKVNHDRKAE